MNLPFGQRYIEMYDGKAPSLMVTDPAVGHLSPPLATAIPSGGQAPFTGSLEYCCDGSGTESTRIARRAVAYLPAHSPPQPWAFNASTARMIPSRSTVTDGRHSPSIIYGRYTETLLLREASG
jgi:hypothetical protein